MARNRHQRGAQAASQRFFRVLYAVYLVLLAFPLLFAVYGFTVDDAFIIARVAAHGAQGRGFVYHLGRPTDAVTPWGYAHLLGALGALLGEREPLALWRVGRVLGVSCVVCSMVTVGLGVRRNISWWWWRAPLWMLSTLPIWIWAGAGMATGATALLVLWGGLLLLRGPSRGLGAVVLGCAAAWRPELCFFGGGLCWFGAALSTSRGAFRRPDMELRLKRCALFALPVVFVMGARLLTFGHVLPLSALAKEPDFSSGCYYAAVSVLWFSAGWGVLARPGSLSCGLWGAYVLHLVGLIVVGGDWMPALRLSAPLAPLLLWYQLECSAPTRLDRGLSIMAPIFPCLLLWQQGPELRQVSERRIALLAPGERALRGAHTVAAVDIGWVGVAHEEDIIDLAGVTEPRIARLMGGHTSKRISPGLFSESNVDAWVVRDLSRRYRVGGSLSDLDPAYLVDARLLARWRNLHLYPTRTIDLPGTGGQYVIFRSRAP